MKLLSRVGFLRMIEPFDTDHHVVSPGLPHALDVSNEGEVWSSSRQEHGTVSNTDCFLPTHYGFVEKLLCLPLHSPPLSEIEGKANGFSLGTFMSFSLLDEGHYKILLGNVLQGLHLYLQLFEINCKKKHFNYGNKKSETLTILIFWENIFFCVFWFSHSYGIVFHNTKHLCH